VAVRVAQALLHGLYADVVIDGVLGPKTAFALLSAPDDIRDLANSFIHPRDYITYDVDTLKLEERAMSEQQEITQVVRAIKRAADRFDLPVKWLVSMAYIESSFNPSAINGQSKGLFQMQAGAWQDAGRYVVLPDYSTHWADPSWNALAAAAYVRTNLTALKNYGLDASVEPRWLYLAHQQGAAGVAYLINACKGKQGHQVVSTQRMLRNPAPGFAPTADPVQFYKNWMAHLEQFF
jgi:hypothetical protein